MDNFDVRYAYPFLHDSETVEFIGKSKVMFIMRGPPGSGKSFTVQLLKQLYPTIVICSSDDFFYSEDGTYQWSLDKLSDAHEFCRLKASNAVLDKMPHIAIDKINIQLCDMKPYFSLAGRSGYTIIIVVSRTPWAFDVVQLARMNTHRVSIERVQLKIDNFEEVIPHYWGWFLNNEDSEYLRSLGVKYFNVCTELVQEFSQFLPALDVGCSHSFNNVYQCDHTACLHCTSVYVGPNKLSEAILRYSCCEAVSRSIGRVFRLMVTGILFTPRTAGLRVQLTGVQCDLFTGPLVNSTVVIQGRFATSCLMQGSLPTNCSSDLNGQANDGHIECKDAVTSLSVEHGSSELSDCWKEESSFKNIKAESMSFKSEKNKSSCVQCANEKDQVSTSENNSSKNCEPIAVYCTRKNNAESLGDSNAKDHGSNPTRDVSYITEAVESISICESAVNSNQIDTHKAHITLGFSKTSRAVQIGLDLLEVISCESATRNVSDVISLDDGDKLCYYGEGRCMVMFHKPIFVDALFSGHY